MGKSRKTLFYDKIHRGSVKTILAFSGVCGMYFFYRLYNFMFVVRPVLREARHTAENELLAEGKASEEELIA